ncbi:protein kinase [Raphidiopsis sp. BLCC-F218]
MNQICCLNPTYECDNPQVPDNTSYCPTCNIPLVILKNRYQPVKRLGGGGFAKTYLALDTHKLNELCVIKQLAPSLGNQTTQALIKATELFLQEAQQLQKLAEHTQIPSLFAYFEENRQLYLVEQFVDGKNLLEELQSEGVFDEAKIRQFLQDLLLILQEVHKQGIIHRDIKPENVMRRYKDGKLVLIDFGASKELQGGATSGTRIGTDGYAAWEQRVDGVASTAGDLYSLGVTCFYLLTSKNPYELWLKDGYNWVANWRNYLNQPLSQKLQQILDKLLVASSENRYSLAEKVLEELRQPYSIIPSISPKTIISHTEKPQRFSYILALISVFILGIGYLVITKSPQFQPRTEPNVIPETDRGL